MKIALVADTFSVEKGTGIARYSQELLVGLTGKGLNVEIIAPEPPNLPFGLAINHAMRMPYLVRSKVHCFDLIHATSPITAIAFLLVNKPRVVTYHDLITLLCRDMNTAFHTRLFAPLFLRIGKFADKITAISSQTKEEMVEHLGITGDKITVVNYGIGEIFRPMNRKRQGEYTIGYVGALARRKAVDYLLRAVHRFKERHARTPLKLVVCGSKDAGGLQYQALRELASKLNINRDVEFRGFVGGERLVRAYNSFDVFLSCSEWEGFGLPILEAQRCGVPVVIREDAHISAEVAKCCLKASSEEDMADQIYELLTNTTLRRAVVDEGLEYSQQFTWERTAQETLRVYEEVMSQT